MYPPYIQWEINNDCNHSCIHCYNYWRNDDYSNRNFIDEKLLSIIVGKIIEQKPAHVIVTGGEPMMYFDNILPYLKKLVNAGILVTINTNATLITDRIAAELSFLQIGCLVSLPCGIGDICDEITKVKKSLSFIKKGVRNLVDNNVDFAVNMVVSQINKNYIIQTAQFAKEELNCNTFFASRVGMPIDVSPIFKKLMLTENDMRDMLDALLYIKDNFGLAVGTSNPFPLCVIEKQEVFDFFAYERICSAGITTCCVDSKGNVKACPREKTTYGNIITDKFSTIWAAMSKWRNEDYIPKVCMNCRHKNGCKGGCRIDSLSAKGRIDVEDTLCIPQNKDLLSLTVDQTHVSYSTFYTFNKPLNCQFDGDYVRLSSRMEYIYLNKKLYSILTESVMFNIENTAHKANSNEKTIHDVFLCLIRNHIIVECGKDKKI